ncbi:MAG: hypothetical protein COB35_11160 [Gammaproteobacteria bacterium]|nr:MAG: hypothetical protein COB35_11160 [Gammaproteobacteria bacterium]
MIFVLAIAAIFLALTIYFFFRVEKLQQKLTHIKTEIFNTRKENKALLESLILVASRQESFVKNRLLQIKNSQSNNDEIQKQLKILTPLINNYAAIFRACLKGKGQLSLITKKCYEHAEPNAFKVFNVLLNQQNIKIKRMWNSNTLSGYIALIEALLLKYENILAENMKETNEDNIERLAQVS